MKKLRFTYMLNVVFVLFIVVYFFQIAAAQKKMDRIEREKLGSMLKNIKNEIKKNYYDPNFHGIDVDARFKLAEDRLGQVTTSGQALGVIAQVLLDFNDSHLYFLPPATNLRVEYGWRMRMIGDKGYIIAVKPKSDAEAKALKVGDQVLSVEGFRPARKELWKMMYYYHIFSKRTSLKLTVLSPGTEQPKEIEVESKITQVPSTIIQKNAFRLREGYVDTKNDEHLFQKIGNITIWRMPTFGFDPQHVDSIINGKVGLTGSLIIDLRSNGGGYVKTLERLVGFLFEKDIKIADLKGRKEMDPIQSKTQGKGIFKGKIIVLIGSESGSASEILARLVQIEKRGQVIGDVSAGSVMQSVRYNGESGSGQFGTFYGASITNADVIMSDGKSVEHVGVVPDILVLPMPGDLANGSDPVLAKAIEALGGQISAEQAGKFFPYDWGKK